MGDWNEALVVQSVLKRIYPQYRLFKAVQPDLEPTEKGNSFLEFANPGLLSEAELQITLMIVIDTWD